MKDNHCGIPYWEKTILTLSSTLQRGFDWQSWLIPKFQLNQCRDYPRYFRDWKVRFLLKDIIQIVTDYCIEVYREESSIHKYHIYREESEETLFERIWEIILKCGTEIEVSTLLNTFEYYFRLSSSTYIVTYNSNNR